MAYSKVINMPERKTLLLLEDILDAAEKIMSYTYKMRFKDFIDNDEAMDAVIRNFEIIGEAAHRIPKDFKADNALIEWRQIIGFRNCIVHAYFQIDYEMVWKIKENNLPELTNSVEKLIDDLYLQSEY